MKERIETLFVLGPVDGVRVAVPPDEFQWRALKRPKPNVDEVTVATVEEIIYTRRFFGAGETMFTLFAPSGVSDAAVLQSLVTHYRPPTLCNS